MSSEEEDKYCNTHTHQEYILFILTLIYQKHTTCSGFSAKLSTTRSRRHWSRHPLTMTTPVQYHTHCSVESVVEQGAAAPSPSSMCGLGRRVVESGTAHVSVQVIEDRGHRSRLSVTCCSETSTEQYIIYNINRTVWNSCRPAKTPRQS